MENKNNIGPFGVGMIFWGAPMVVIALFTISIDSLAKFLGDKGVAYLMVGVGACLYFVSIYLLDRIPRNRAIIIGLLGWLLTLSIFFYWYCFGPGAFGHGHY